uniref:Uncharacterized protein n=1 Tax=Anguilla anguilla TaxID=7936 RepID=A0A0E9Q8Y1_ANGAN
MTTTISTFTTGSAQNAKGFFSSSWFSTGGKINAGFFLKLEPVVNLGSSPPLTDLGSRSHTQCISEQK